MQLYYSEQLKERLKLTSAIMLHILYSYYWLSLKYTRSPYGIAIMAIGYSVLPIVSSLLCLPIAKKINRDGGTLIQVTIALYIGIALRIIYALLQAKSLLY